MAATLGGARKMRDAALAAVAGLFLLGALLGRSRNEGYKHGGTAATALLLNAAEVCSARRLRRR